jgi:hypothetical protein
MPPVTRRRAFLAFGRARGSDHSASGRGSVFPDPFGSQPRADAASNLIRIGVQQAISSLPPSSAQAFTCRFDPQLSTFTRSDSLGPIVLRSPTTIGPGQLAIRFAASYFDLEREFAPIGYRVEGDRFTLFTRLRWPEGHAPVSRSFSVGDDR